jgi:citrate synthase
MLDEEIWNMLVSLSNDHDFEDCDPEYKQQLIDGYKIISTCAIHNTYNFKTIEEEETYFSRSDVTAAEEVYYYTFVIQWEPPIDTHLFNLSLISGNEWKL